MGLLLSRTHLHGENNSPQSRLTRTDNQGRQPPHVIKYRELIGKEL